MEKIILSVLCISLFLWADVEKECLKCHRQQKIPSELIYKRYLMTYSTAKYIEEAIFSYLKNPTKKSSIMPPQFFLKFPMKKASKSDDTDLRNSIRKYIKMFDVKKRLILKD